jgi:micrococcal nuclease
MRAMPANSLRLRLAVCTLFISFYQLVVFLPGRAESFIGKVVAISDGDTITVMRGRIGEKVRLDGIDAPERKQDYGNRSRQFVASKVFGKTVEVDFKETDKYGRMIGVVVLPDKTNLNHEIVRNGCAWWYRKYAPDDETLERLELEARTEKRGLWRQPNPIPPWEFRRASGSYQNVPVKPLPSGELPIIGNRSSRIYHRPNCDTYYKISPRNRVVFGDEGAAQRAGYRLARNCH